MAAVRPFSIGGISKAVSFNISQSNMGMMIYGEFVSTNDSSDAMPIPAEVFQHIRAHHVPPVEINKVPLVGFIELIAAGRLLGDDDILNGAGIFWESKEGRIIKGKICKTSAPGACGLVDTLGQSVDTANSKSIPLNKDLRIDWDRLSEGQQNQFLDCLGKGIPLFKEWAPHRNMPNWITLITEIYQLGLPDLADIEGQNEAAKNLLNRGDLVNAEKLCKKAVAQMTRIHKNVQRRKDLHEVDGVEDNVKDQFVYALQNLGHFHFLSENWKEAHDCYDRALGIQGELCRGIPTQLVDSLMCLAEVSACKGNFLVTVGLYEKTMQNAYTLTDDKHEDSPITLINLAKVYISLGKFKEAMEYLDNVQVWMDGNKDPLIKSRFLNLKGTLQRLYGYPEAALKLQEEAIALCSENHSLLMAELYNCKARSLGELSRISEAEQIHLDALFILQQLYRKGKHPELASTYVSLARICAGTNRLDGATRYIDAALAIFEQNDCHPALAAALALKGYLVADPQDKRRFTQDAIRMYQDLYEKRPHPILAIVLENMAILHRDFPEAAKGYYEEALKIKVAFYGQQHEKVAQTRRKIEELDRSIIPTNSSKGKE